MRHLWDLLLGAMTEPDGAADAAAFLPLLARIRDLEHELTERELLHGTELLKRVRSALGALRNARTIDDLFGQAAVAVSGLGFDRALLSTVDESTWRLHSMHVDRDARWAEEILAVGRESPPVLDRGIVEHDVVVGADAVLVKDVQQNPRVNGPLAAVTRSDSYGIAPLTLDGLVVGLVHGDCYHQKRQLGERDRALLGLFAEGLSHILGRVAMLERLRALQAGLADLSLPTPPPRAHDKASPVPAAPHALLTRRENEIMQLLANGDSNRILARRLSITEGTAKCHVTSILRKLGAANRAEAVSIWLRSR
jgi:DNA-binding CsgD family transcriptional regulator